MSRRTLRTVAPSALSMLAVITLLAGCPRSNDPYFVDGGPLGDAPDPARVDTDLDGLCDVQEIARGLLVDDADTDMDGYSDLVEVSLGFDPLGPGSPDRDRIVILSEIPGSTARVTMTASVSATGESFTGAFAATRQAFEDGIDGADFFDSSSALAAEPMGSVFALEGPTFVGVRGRAILTSEIRLRFAGPQLGCLRAYPFQYVVKRQDGRIVAVARFTLVVQPDGSRPGDGEWCGARPCW